MNSEEEVLHQKCKTCRQQTHRWEPWSKDSLKPIGPSGKCHSPQIFQSHHHDRGATSDLLHDPRGLLGLVKLADGDTRQSEYYNLHVYSTVAMGPSYSEDTVPHNYLPRTRKIPYLIIIFLVLGSYPIGYTVYHTQTRFFLHLRLWKLQ